MKIGRFVLTGLAIVSLISLSVYGVMTYRVHAQTVNSDGTVTIDPNTPPEDLINIIRGQASTSTDLSGVPEIDEQLSIDVTPQNPRPGDDVTISVATYGSDMNAATISWTVNGSVVSEGVGQRSITLKAGANGETTTVFMKFVSQFGKVSGREITIRPQTVDIVYESRSYTPPFYKGRSLYGPQGNLVMLAVPNLVDSRGVVISPDNLIYTWTVDGEVQGQQSGYGRSTFYFTGPTLIKDSEVRVAVTSKDGSATGEAAISVAPITPYVLTYENRPLLGILFNQAMGNNFTLNDTEVTVEAFPYFFDTTTKDGDNLTYNWGINGTAITLPRTQNKLVLRNSSGGSGQSDITVNLSNDSQFLQKGGKILSVLFNSPRNNDQAF